MDVNHASWGFLISSCSYTTNVSAVWNRSLATLLYPHNHPCMSLSLCCSKRAFDLFSYLQSSVQIISYAMLLGLGTILRGSHCCHHSLDVLMRSAVSLYCIWLPEVMKGSFSEHWPLYSGLTLLMGKMLDVARYGPLVGQLCYFCQG